MNETYGRLLSFILRHKPEVAGCTADEHGWVNVDDLLQGIDYEFYPVDMETLIQVVETDSKQRFAFNEDKTKIRAVQGHSFPVDLQLECSVPPAILYHGTAKKSLESIVAKGLDKRSRQYVHLTDDINVAYETGKRHGEPVVICGVNTHKMIDHGYCFYKSENNVWLTDNIPVKYLMLVECDNRENDLIDIKRYIETIFG